MLICCNEKKNCLYFVDRPTHFLKFATFISKIIIKKNKGKERKKEFFLAGKQVHHERFKYSNKQNKNNNQLMIVI